MKAMTFFVLVVGCLFTSSLWAQPNFEMSTPSVEALFFDAIKERTLGNFERAVSLLNEAVALKPSDAAIYFELGKNLRLLKQYDLAEMALLESDKYRPDDEWILNALYALYEDMAADDKVLQVLKRLASMHPDYQEDLVSFYIEQGRFTDALMELNDLESQYKTTPSRQEKRALLLSLMTPKAQKDYKEDLELLITSKKWDLALLEIQNQWADKDASSQIKSEVLKMITTDFIETKPNELLELLIQYAPSNDLLTLTLKTDIYLRLSQNEDALRLSDEGLMYYPAQPRLYLLNGIALNRLSRWQEAAAILETGLAFVISGQDLEGSFYDELILAYSALNQDEMVDLYSSKKKDLE